MIDQFGYNHIEIQPETEKQLGSGACRNSQMFRTIAGINPDVLLVDLLWFPIFHFINDLSCKKVFLSRQVSDRFFSIPLSTGTLNFNPDDYDRIIAIEPFDSCIDMEFINPIIFRNRAEILGKEEALHKLGLNRGKPVCLLAYNGHPGDYKRVKNLYSYLGDEGYQMVYTSNYKGGIFPVVDYFNAFDFIVCGAGYNAFWETVYFDKEAIIIPTNARFEDPGVRIDRGADFTFDGNGADQLVDIMMNM